MTCIITSPGWQRSFATLPFFRDRAAPPWREFVLHSQKRKLFLSDDNHFGFAWFLGNDMMRIYLIQVVEGIGWQMIQKRRIEWIEQNVKDPTDWDNDLLVNQPQMSSNVIFWRKRNFSQFHVSGVLFLWITSIPGMTNLPWSPAWPRYVRGMNYSPDFVQCVLPSAEAHYANFCQNIFRPPYLSRFRGWGCSHNGLYREGLLLVRLAETGWGHKFYSLDLDR